MSYPHPSGQVVFVQLTRSLGDGEPLSTPLLSLDHDFFYDYEEVRVLSIEALVYIKNLKRVFQVIYRYQKYHLNHSAVIFILFSSLLDFWC